MKITSRIPQLLTATHLTMGGNNKYPISTLFDDTLELKHYDPSDELADPICDSFMTTHLELDWEQVITMDENGIFQPANQEENTVNIFLAQLNYNEVIGREPTVSEYFGYPKLEEPNVNAEFDSYAYATACWHCVLHDQLDPAQVAPYLGY